MNRNDFDQSFAPTDTTPVTSTDRGRGKAFGAGVATGFTLCGLLLGGGFAIYQLTARPTNNAIAPTAPPAPVATAPTTNPTSAPVASPTTAPTAASPAAPSASTTGVYETNGTDGNEKFNVRVVELKRVSGNSVLLKLALTNTGQTNGGFSFLNVTPNESIYVVDTQTQQKAYPLKDANGKAVASEPIYGVDPGQTVEVFTQFPAPAATTQRLTVYFPKASSPIADVPITQ